MCLLMEESGKRHLIQDRGKNNMMITRIVSPQWSQEKRVKTSGEQWVPGDAIVVVTIAIEAPEDMEVDIEVVDGAVKETDRVKTTILVQLRVVDTHLEVKIPEEGYVQGEE